MHKSWHQKLICPVQRRSLEGASKRGVWFEQQRSKRLLNDYRKPRHEIADKRVDNTTPKGFATVRSTVLQPASSGTEFR